MGWKKMLFGEKMPDKNDPKYRQRYENEVNAGRKFAKTMRIDMVAGKVQLFANEHKRLFIILVFGFVILSFGLNIYRMAVVYNQQQSRQSATERQELMLRNRHNKIRRTVTNAHAMPPGEGRENQMNNNKTDKR